MVVHVSSTFRSDDTEQNSPFPIDRTERSGYAFAQEFIHSSSASTNREKSTGILERSVQLLENAIP